MGRLRPTEARRWGDFFARHERALAAYAIALAGDPDAAEDLVQEALLRSVAYRRPIDRALPFVLRCMRNLCIDGHRRSGTRGPVVALDLEFSAPIDTQTGAYGDREWATRVRDAVEALSADRREVVVLKTYAGLTLPRIGQVLGRPTGTVSSLYARGLADLRRVLAPEIANEGSTGHGQSRGAREPGGDGTASAGRPGQEPAAGRA